MRHYLPEAAFARRGGAGVGRGHGRPATGDGRGEVGGEIRLESPPVSREQAGGWRPETGGREHV